jgi:hypothetical protein
LGESSRSKDRSRSTHYDRYAEHTMKHGSLKFFVADSDDEPGVLATGVIPLLCP